MKKDKNKESTEKKATTKAELLEKDKSMAEKKSSNDDKKGNHDSSKGSKKNKLIRLFMV